MADSVFVCCSSSISAELTLLQLRHVSFVRYLKQLYRPHRLTDTEKDTIIDPHAVYNAEILTYFKSSKTRNVGHARKSGRRRRRSQSVWKNGARQFHWSIWMTDSCVTISMLQCLQSVVLWTTVFT